MPAGDLPLSRHLAGKVAVVTGAGGGIGRAHALALARHGACVVVNDVGATMDGRDAQRSGADAVVAEIAAIGGRAVTDGGDISTWQAAEALVARALDCFGALDILVNNAGILRPKTIVGMTEDDVHAVLRVHLHGTFAVTHFAALHWRDRFKADGTGGGRLINTTSAAGLFGHGQANYTAAKAGIAAFTAVAASEFARYGATANAIAPLAVSRMSTGMLPAHFTPEHAAEFVCWLAGDAAREITGQVFSVGGGHISVVERWHTGASIEKDGLWSLGELDARMPEMMARVAPHPDLMGYRPGDERSALLPGMELPRNDR